MIFFFLVAGSFVGNTPDAIRVDRIEFNSVYDPQDTARKEPKFVQMILWRWGRDGYEICDFVVIQPHTLICRSTNTVTLCHNGNIISLRSRQIIDTTATFDHERRDVASGRRRFPYLHSGTRLSNP